MYENLYIYYLHTEVSIRNRSVFLPWIFTLCNFVVKRKIFEQVNHLNLGIITTSRTDLTLEARNQMLEVSRTTVYVADVRRKNKYSTPDLLSDV